MKNSKEDRPNCPSWVGRGGPKLGVVVGNHTTSRQGGISGVSAGRIIIDDINKEDLE